MTAPTGLPSAAQKVHDKAVQHGWIVQVAQGEDPPGVLLQFRKAHRERMAARWDGRVSTDGSVTWSFAWAGQWWRPTQPEGGVSPRRIGAKRLAELLVET